MRTLTLSVIACLALNGCINDRGTDSDDQPIDRNGTTLPTGPTFGSTTDGEIVDADGDGFLSDTDCDDANVGVYPGAAESCDGVDQNCSGVVDEGVYMCTYSDNDFDGFTPNTGDCDDYNDLAHPGATEECNGFDDNCDGQIDEANPAARTNECGDVDGDEDGYYADLDCNDVDATIHPGALELPYDGIDQDCSGSDLIDADGDTYAAIAAGGTDCNDVSAAVHPGATEVVGNGTDDDCNAATADGAEIDLDGDGASVTDGDCNDSNATVYPAAPELCDGLDNDCDTVVDDNVEVVDWYLDVDLDGHGNSIPVPACSAPPGHVALGDDCNDNDITINPNATEVPYDGIDQDCMGGDLNDVDCDLVAAPLDCDDTNEDIHPGALEIVGDGLDNDCDASTEDADGVGGNVDTDDDLDGYWEMNGDDAFVDCDDTDPNIHPGAVEIADDGVDQDCVGGDLVTVVDNGCNDGYSVVSGSFVAPVGATINSIGGMRLGGDDDFGWTTWSDGVPLNMSTTITGNMVEFTLDSCVADVGAVWNASVAYTDINGVVHYDCESSAFTGTWNVEFDSTNQIVNVFNHVSDAGCEATW